MLIWVDDSIFNNDDVGILENVLSKVAMAHQEGYHYIICSNEVLRELILMKNPRIYDAFEEASRRYIELQATISQVDYYIKLVNETEEAVKSTKNNVIEYQLNLELFSRTSLYLPTNVIFEDFEDRYTYYLIASNYLKSQRSLNIRLSAINGGGSNTHKAIMMHSYSTDKDSRMTVCLYDSDIKYEGGGKGGTAVSIERAARSANILFDNMMINTHEVENLYSIDILNMATSDVNAQYVKNLLAKVQSMNPSLYRYVDIKNGIRTKNIKFPKDQRQKEFNLKLLEIIGMEDSEIIRRINECSCSDRESCRCILVNGYPSIMQCINSHIDQFQTLDASQVLFPELHEEWRRIGRYVASWCLVSGDAL